MNRDYVILCEKKDNLPNLVQSVFELYKPYIYSRAKKYASYFHGRIVVQDFISDTYVQLYYFLGRLEEEKIKNKETFNFVASINFAISRVKTACGKIMFNETTINSLSDKEDYDFFDSNFESKINVSETIHEFNNYLGRLTKRQRRIVEDRMQGKHEKITLKELKIAHGTYNSEMQKAKAIFKDYI